MLDISNSQTSENCDGNYDPDVADEENCSSQVLGRAPDEVPGQILSAGTDEIAVQPTLSSLMGEYDSSCTSYLDTAFSSWHTSTLTGPVEQVAWTDDVRPAEQQDDQFSMLISHDDGNPGPGCHDEPRRLTSNPAGMDMVERVACILRYLGTMGFDNFDELVCTYYTQNFHESSLLCNEQRLSRHRRLPGVFSSVFCASGNWSIWERRGFQEEVSKATEEALLSESWEAQSDIHPAVTHMLKAPKSNLPCVASRVSPLKSCITNKVRLPECHVCQNHRRIILFITNEAELTETSCPISGH